MIYRVSTTRGKSVFMGLSQGDSQQATGTRWVQRRAGLPQPSSPLELQRKVFNLLKSKLFMISWMMRTLYYIYIYIYKYTL